MLSCNAVIEGGKSNYKIKVHSSCVLWTRYGQIIYFLQLVKFVETLRLEVSLFGGIKPENGRIKHGTHSLHTDSVTYLLTIIYAGR